VTGSHRSGTTWVGRTLVHNRRLGWVAEPFHPQHRRGVFAAPTSRWYTYVCAENEDAYVPAMTATLSGRYNLGQAVRHVRRPLDGALVGRDLGRFVTRRALRQRALLKDPLAFFSTPWLADRFGADVIVLVRHPAAVAQSLRRLDWRFDFEHWLAQPLLRRDLLWPWDDELASMADRGQDGRDVIDEAALLWKVLYGVALDWRAARPGWLFVRHEDLSADPLHLYPQLFAQAGLSMTRSARRYIERTTSTANPVSAPEGHAHALARDSRANARSWTTALGEAQVERLRAATAPVADQWYGPDDW
jgi:Sulfotransferase family